MYRSESQPYRQHASRPGTHDTVDRSFYGIIMSEKWQTVQRKEQKDKEICEILPLLCLTGKNPSGRL